MNKTLEAMPLATNFDISQISQDLFFIAGEKMGEEKGVQKGEKIGAEKGEAKSRQILIVNMLKKQKFDKEMIADLADVPTEFVEKIEKAYHQALDLLKQGYSDAEIVEKTGLFVEVLQKLKP